MATILRNKLAAVKELVRDAYRNGATIREIAEVHNASPGTVRNTLIEMGEKLRARGRKRKEVTSNDVLPVNELPIKNVEETDNGVCEPTL